MPTVLVIDDEPAIHFSVSSAVPDWTVLAAADGTAGLDVIRQRLADLDLVVLDINMPGLDGYHTCLRIRALSRTLPILPFTAIGAAALFLGELGCAPVLLKPAHPDDLRAALHAAIGASAPMQPGAAVLAFAQQQSAAHEQAVRQAQALVRVALFASSPVTRLGLAQLLAAAGTLALREATTAEALRRLLAATAIGVLVAPASDGALADGIARACDVPLLLVASTPIEGLAAAGWRAALGVALATDALTPARLAGQLAAVAARQPSIPPELAAPFAGTPLTPREQELVALQVQGLPSQQIADRLGVAPDSVRRALARIGQKLGLLEEADVRRWAEDWLRQRLG